MATIQAPAPRKAAKATGKLVVYNDPSAFGLLRDDWRNLEQRDSRCGVFQSHTWLSHVWLFDSGPRTELCLVAVYGGDGRLDALAPLLIEHRMGAFGVRVLRLIGGGVSDYQDILLADDGDRDSALSMLADWFHLQMQQLDMIELLKVQQGAHLWEHHDRFLPRGVQRCIHQAESYDQSRYFPIETNFDDYLMTLSKPTRKNYRRYWSQLNQAYSIQLGKVTCSSEADDILVELYRLHQQRQIARGQRGMFRTPERIAVFTHLFKAMLDEGTLRLHVMAVDGRVYNVEIVLYYKSTATAYNGGMAGDPAVMRLSPGFLAMMKIIELAHADPRLKVFDLGQGNEPYKAHIAKHIQPLQRVCCTRLCMRSRIDRLYHGLRAWAHQSPTVQRLYFGVHRPSTTAVDTDA